MRKGGDWRSLSDPGKVAPVLVPAHPRHPPRAPPVGGQEEDGNVGRVPDDDGVELGRDCAKKYTMYSIYSMYRVSHPIMQRGFSEKF